MSLYIHQAIPCQTIGLNSLTFVWVHLYVDNLEGNSMFFPSTHRKSQTSQLPCEKIWLFKKKRSILLTYVSVSKQTFSYLAIHFAMSEYLYLFVHIKVSYLYL